MRVTIIAASVINVLQLMVHVVQYPTPPVINVILQRGPSQNRDLKPLAIIITKGQTAVNVTATALVSRKRHIRWFPVHIQGLTAQQAAVRGDLRNVQRPPA